VLQVNIQAKMTSKKQKNDLWCPQYNPVKGMHTSVNLAAQLMKIATDWNIIWKIAGVVSDNNAFNIKHLNVNKNFLRFHIYILFYF